MKTLVIFYSFKGHTKAFAENKAEELGADIVEVKEAKKRGTFSAFTKGCFCALKQKSVKVQPFFADFKQYSKIIICAPIWAGLPAPAFNNIVENLFEGAEVEVYAMSGSGKSEGKSKVIAKIEKQGAKVLSYNDIKESK